MAIPLVLHQVYGIFQDNKPMPKQWIECSETLRKNNSNLQYKLWNYESCLDLLKTHYSWFLDTYLGYKYPIQRADAIRPFILYHYGGIYFDMDFKCVKNITNYFKNAGVYILESSHHGLTNSLMASSKYHPFWKGVFSQMIKSSKKKMYQTHHMYIMQSTGPSLITKCCNKYRNNDMYIIPKRIFNPCNVCKKQCKLSDKVYCHTTHSGTWHKGVDTKIFNILYCHHFKILFCIILVIAFKKYNFRALR